MTELHLFLLPRELFFFERGGQYFVCSILSSKELPYSLQILGITQNCLLTMRVKRQWQHCCCFFVLPELGIAAFVVSQTVVPRFLLVHYGLIGVVVLSAFVCVWQIALQDCFLNTH